MKLSILIATVGWREGQFVALVDKLLQQANKYPGEIEIIAYWNNGELPVAGIRRALIEQATGKYICFIDDDDDVPEEYCANIMRAIESDPDYVGFRVAFFDDGKEMPPVFHSIKYTHWHQDERGYYRGVTHLNPIRRSIAIRGTFGIDSDAGEDEKWAISVTPFVETEEYIDDVMYFYYHDRSKTTFGGDRKPQGKYGRPVIINKQFSYHPDSKENS